MNIIFNAFLKIAMLVVMMVLVSFASALAVSLVPLALTEVNFIDIFLPFYIIFFLSVIAWAVFDYIYNTGEVVWSHEGARPYGVMQRFFHGEREEK